MSHRENYFQRATPIDLSFLAAVSNELADARCSHAPMNSAHEAYAVILEEVDEFWEEVRKRRSERNPSAMYAELVQIAAMAARAAGDVIAERRS